MSYKTETRERRIIRWLNSHHFKPHLDGFNAIKEAIMMYDNNTKITSVVYPSVAKKTNSTPARVERAIRYAITESNLKHMKNQEVIATAYLEIVTLGEE